MTRSVCLMVMLGCGLLLGSSLAHGQNSRLVATGGGSMIEGGSGGGIVPWATVAGYSSEGEWGGAAFITRVDSGDYRLDSRGLALGWGNRLELSVTDQRFELPTLASALALPTDRFRQRVIGAKLRLYGDLVYDDWPQISLGVQHKKQRDFLVPSLVGAKDDSDIDWYLAASRLWLGGAAGRNLLTNLTVRSTRANQTGLLGFGGDRKSSRSVVAEASVAVLLNRHWAVGAEYRQKPDNLGFAHEDDWRDVFVAWFPNKTVSVVAAWADLGSIATLQGQEAWYVSIQLSR